MRPMASTARSGNHRLPAGPVAMAGGRRVGGVWLAALVPAGGAGRVYRVSTPRVVILAIWLAPGMVNQRLPSGPAAISCGPVLAGMSDGRPNSVRWPPGVIRPIFLALISVNHRFPSRPATMPFGPLVGSGSGNTVSLPAGVIRPIAPPE